MSRLDFVAEAVSVTRPADDNFAGDNSSVTWTTQPTVDPLIPAALANNVRFAFSGSAGHGGFETAMVTLNTFHTFNINSPTPGQDWFVEIAAAHFLPQGGVSMTARRPTWIFDGPGFVTLNVFIGMRTRVFNPAGRRVLNVLQKPQNIFSVTRRGGQRANSVERTLDPEPLELSLMEGFGFIRASSIQIQARYTVQLIATDGASFLVDFASMPGDGLNVPLAVAFDG